MAQHAHPVSRKGLAAAIGAYFLWGIMPLYLLLVREVPPVEFVGWRILWTIPLCLGILAVRGQLGELASSLRNRRLLLILALSALLIATNWLIYVWAIVNGKVYAASLGYYLNPLVNIVLGTVLLKERLSRLQWLAVCLAGMAVALLLAGAPETLWISLALALSFGLYGLLRKQAPVGALAGLTVETLLLAIPSALVIAAYAASPQGTAFGHVLLPWAAIAAGGVMTAIPLLLFTVAARELPYSTLGFIQYLAPTMVFVLGLVVFHEPLRLAQLGSFILIWSAIAIFVTDIWRRYRAEEMRALEQGAAS